MGLTTIYNKLCDNPKLGRNVIDKNGKRKTYCYLECGFLIVNSNNDYICEKGFMGDNDDE